MLQHENIIIKQFAEKLSRGDIIAIPTETVYGLAADMSNENAVKQIYKIKSRPTNHPLIVHIANKNDIFKYAIDVPSYVELLTDKFWPGPLTFILKKSPLVPYYVTGGQDTVAIRMPSHQLTLKLINMLGKPIVAPSANKFKGISPTRAEHVMNEFGTIIEVLDGGICNNGIESTIIDATDSSYYTILRPGAVTAEDIKNAISYNYPDIKYKEHKNSNIKYSGNHLKHYSPQKLLVSFENKDQLDLIRKKSKNVFIIYYSSYNLENLKNTYKLSSNLQDFTRDFYHVLRLADNSDSEIIAIESPPQKSNWNAVWDRLNKAKHQDKV